MRGFHEPGQFIRGNQGHVTRATAPDNYDFPVVHYLVENRSKFVAQMGIGCFNGHEFIVQVSCTPDPLPGCG